MKGILYSVLVKFMSPIVPVLMVHCMIILQLPMASHAILYLILQGFFHVVDGIVPDIMHDILEGTLQLHIKWLLSYLILDKKMFSLDTLNGRMQSFNYGSVDSSNKPTPISNVKQSCKCRPCWNLRITNILGPL